MNFFTQGFLFSRTEFRINNNKISFKVTVFFFTRKCTLVINSFISENSVSAKRKKKSIFFFQFPRKSSLVIQSDFDEVPFFMVTPGNFSINGETE